MSDSNPGKEGGHPSARDDDYEEQWEQLDGKVLLAQLLAEQQRTNMLLEQALQSDTDAAESDSTRYECKRCDWEGNADERQRHARSAHNTPVDMVDAQFEEV